MAEMGSGAENSRLRADCECIVRQAVAAVMPEEAVCRALDGFTPPHGGRLILIAVGKAAWTMADAAYRTLTERNAAGASLPDPAPVSGAVITKYGHSRGPIGPLEIYEAGHPVPDGNTWAATERVLALTGGLSPRDTVLFLLSGGGSALFESPLIPPEELQAVTAALLSSGADITEINTIRKHLSRVKGGRFARHAAPARVFTVVLSDVIGDPLDVIASGPAYPDPTTATDARRIAEKYALPLSDAARAALDEETPKTLDNVTTVVTGSVRALCRAAADACASLGYEPIVLTDRLSCEASEAGRFLSSIARTHAGDGVKRAFLAGGETVVHLRGHGLGGRNQELALAAAPGLDGLGNAAVFSVGSDGTDGPTDAAGGYVDGSTARRLRAAGIDPEAALADNDSYRALSSVGGLLLTGPTGTNVNDVSVVLIDETHR